MLNKQNINKYPPLTKAYKNFLDLIASPQYSVRTVYEHYIQKQVKPLAEDILAINGSNFDDLMGGDQLALF